MAFYLLFIVVLVVVLAGWPWYVWARLIRPLGGPRRWRRLSWAVVQGIILLTPISMFLSREDEGAATDALLASAHLLLGLFLYLLVWAVVRDAAWLPVRFLAVRDANRRKVWLRRSCLVAMGAAVLCTGVGMVQALGPPRIVERRLAIDGLPAELEGYRIAHLSDMHIDPWRGRAAVEKIVALTNSLQPDMVAITGDLADGSVAWRGKDAAPLSDLVAPVYFVTGNHEYYSGAADWVRFLRGLGITVLDGDSRVVRRGDARLLIAGVPDPSLRGGEPAFRVRDPAGAAHGRGAKGIKILLAHRPTDAYAAADAGFDLVLCGHTHGGQLFPGTILIHWIQPFAAGLYRYKGMWINTSRGTGFWGPPVRFLNPPEIVLITLARGR